jgi:HD superfamily phosphohydrolase YqeK
MLNKNNTNYLLKAKEIIHGNDLEPYVQSLLKLWIDTNPPSIGHGFGHVLEVAVESYELAQLNRYEKPQELFIAGLLHDVYRPAEGKDGQEDHHQRSYELALKILEGMKSEANFVTKFKYALSDEWKQGENLDEFASILFLGDKSCLDRRMADAYAWASNKYCEINGKDLVYKSALSTMNGFVHYFHKIIPMLLKIDLKGKDKIIDNFVEIVSSLRNQHVMDPSGKDFQKYLETEAKKFSNKEKKYLSEFIKREKDINKLLGSFDN